LNAQFIETSAKTGQNVQEVKKYDISYTL